MNISIIHDICIIQIKIIFQGYKKFNWKESLPDETKTAYTDVQIKEKN